MITYRVDKRRTVTDSVNGDGGCRRY